MSKLNDLSGQEIIKILCNKFGFFIARQRGSHVVLKKTNGETIGTVVPVHKSVKIGTLRGILELAKISVDDFEKHI